jgi:chromate transporter
MIMQQSDATTTPDHVPFWQAFLFWLKLGFISFGGPAGQIAVMHQELVEQKRWISEKRFLHALNYCMLLPGPEAQQLAIYIGWLMHRTLGGLVAGILFVLPSLFILIALSWIYVQFGDVPIIAGLFYGIKPAVTAIVFHATYRIGSRSLKNKFLWLIAAAAFIAIFFFNIPFPLIVFSAAILGYLLSKKQPHLFSQQASHQSNQKNYGAALIDDNTPPPAHAIFRWANLAKIVLIAAFLWCIPILLLTFSLGWQHAYTQMAWFFTKAALLTFGGAYAVCLMSTKVQ